MQHDLCRQLVITGATAPVARAFTQAVALEPDERVTALEVLVLSTSAAMSTGIEVKLYGSQDLTSGSTALATATPKITAGPARAAVTGDDLSGPWRYVRAIIEAEDAGGASAMVAVSVRTTRIG